MTRFNINGTAHEVQVASETRLIELLHALGLTAAQDLPGCDIVLVEGRPVAAGLTLAALHDGARIETAEGPAAQALLAGFAAQGAAGQPETPALVMTALQALRINPWMTADEARAALLGHACAGTGHAPVVAAMLAAAARARGEEEAAPDTPGPAIADPVQAVAAGFGWDNRAPGGTALDEDGRLRLGCGAAADAGVAVAVEVVVDRDTGHAALSRLAVAPAPVHAPVTAALTQAIQRALFAAPDAPHAFSLPDVLWSGPLVDADPAGAEVALATALAAAIADATGMPMLDLPLTPDRILAAILARDPI
jgi:xanthine dehydrogenase YagT iron-sulfur-binding subunit